MKRHLFLSFPKAARLLLAALICLPFWGTALMAQPAQPEAYAVFDSSNGTLTFKYDNSKPADAYLMNTGIYYPDWYDIAMSIKKVVFDPSFAGARPTSCNGWFNNCKNLTDIEGLSNLNTEEVTTMWNMFDGCEQLTSLDISHFDTEKVTDMNFMFNNCEKLASLDISSFDTKNVEYMFAMFQSCSSLTSLDLSHFNTEKVTDMSSMFNGCSSLTSLDLSHFNTGEVTDMSGMICNCSSLESLNISSFNTEKVTDMSWVFNSCEKLASLDLSSFNTENVMVMEDMFSDCSSLASLNLSSFNTEKVTDMSWMFNKCTSLTSLDLSSFNTKKVTDMNSMFGYCTSLASLNLSSFNTENVTDMGGMFQNCTALTTIYASDNFVTTSVTSGTDMFKDCTALKGAIEYDASKTDHSYANLSNGYFSLKPIIAYAVFDSSNGTLTFKYDGNKPNGAYYITERKVFPNWTNIIDNIKKVVFDTSFAEARPTSCYGWFYNCQKLTAIEGISNLNTEEVTDMSSMFGNCSSLTSLDLSSFKTEKMTEMSYMFSNCEKLASLDISSFNTENVTRMSWMFADCPALTTIYASDKFVVTNVESDVFMFDECEKLKGAIGYDENKTNSSYANYTTGYFTFKIPTSIDAINGNDKAEYFDINGKRGTKLQRGINLVRRGNKTYKVVVK